MDDHALSTQLLCGKPTKVVLVGKPIFRLKANLNDLLADGPVDGPVDRRDSAPAPKIAEYDDIGQFRTADGCVSHTCALALYLGSDANDLEQSLGVACRMSPGLVLVEYTNAKSGLKLLDDQQFFAHGFRRMSQSTEVSGLQQRWYAYSLRDYKKAPDWLNARFWAHPERFDLQD